MTVATQVRLELRHYPYHAPLIATRQRFSLRRKGRIPVHSIGSNGGRRLAWSRGFTPPRGYQSPVMDGDPGALVTPRRSGPEVVGSNPTGPTKRHTHREKMLTQFSTHTSGSKQLGTQTREHHR